MKVRFVKVVELTGAEVKSSILSYLAFKKPTEPDFDVEDSDGMPVDLHLVRLTFTDEQQS